MYYANIKYMDVSNGEGIRTSLFVSGCKNRCKGCFNPCTWDFLYGEKYTKEVEDKIIESIKPDMISGLSILGGDPMEIENQPTVLELINRFRIEFGNTKNIWLWTGYIYDFDLVENAFHKGRRYLDYVTDEILKEIDVIIDGPFIEDLKDLNLKWRGSSNQRIINLK